MRDGGQRATEGTGRLDEVDEHPADVQAQRDAHRLTPRPSCVQPACVVPDPFGEVPFATVVRLPVRGVVREVLCRCPGGLEHLPYEALRRTAPHDAPLVQVEDVRQVGEVQSAVEQGRVRVLEGEPALDEGARRTLDRWAESVHVVGLGLVGLGHRTHRATASSRPPVCQNTVVVLGSS